MAPAGEGPVVGEVPGVHVVERSAVAGLDADRAGDEAALEAVLESRALPSPVAVADLERLATLARRVAVAERVVLRTRERAARRAADSSALADGTGIALHPESIRAAADALLVARARLADADADAGDETDDADADEIDGGDETDDVGLRAVGSRAVGSRAVEHAPSAAGEVDPRAEPGASGAAATASEEGAGVAPDPHDAVAPFDAGSTGRLDWDPARSRRHALGAGLVGTGGSLAAAGAGAAAWVILVPLLVGLVVASWTLRVPPEAHELPPGRSGPGASDDTDGEQPPAHPDAHDGESRAPATVADGRSGDTDVSDRLAEIAALTDRAFGGSPSAGDRDAARRAERDLAAEEVRVAERAWQAIAGRGVEPSEVDDVLRRHDPQHQDVLVVAAEATAVRAAQRLLASALDGWTAAWRELGLDPPDPTVTASDALAHLRRRATTPLVLSGDAVAAAEVAAARLPAAAVLVVDPADDAIVPGPSGPGTTSG